MGTTTTASHKTVVLVRSGLVASAPRSAPIATESVTFATSASDKNGVCLLRIAANPSKKRLPHPQSEQMDPFNGTGITSVQIHKREDKIELRTEHTVFVGAMDHFDPTQNWLQNTACYIFSVNA